MAIFSDQNFQNALLQLNPQQLEAVKTIEGPVMVIAGPGSGKTQILSLRVANILKETDVSQSNILCLTFTDAAAKNMQERLAKYLGSDAYKVQIHTFHSFCSMIINQYCDLFVERFGLGARPIEEYLSAELFKQLFESELLSNPLVQQSQEHGYYHLRDVVKAISKLKENGILDDQFKILIQKLEVEVNSFLPIVPELQGLLSIRLQGAANIAKFVNLARSLSDTLNSISNQLIEDNGGQSFVSFIIDIATILASKLDAYDKGKGTHKDIKAYLGTFFDKDENNQSVFKVLKKIPQYHALASIYGKYNKMMYSKSYFDFNDMIIEVGKVLNLDPELKFNLMEKFQYILVDEFQDTNMAQISLVNSLIDKEFNGGKPNIMVVGDDDQSIYKFQGATTANIAKFVSDYDPKVISLQKNYRSSKLIVETSRSLASRLQDNINNILPNHSIDKDITAHNELNDSQLHKLKFDSEIEECYFVAQQIKNLIASGVEPNEIAVLSRKHSRLEKICHYLVHHQVPVNYEKANNVLDNPKIKQLLTMMEYVDSLNKNTKDEKEDLLIKIFGFDCFGIAAIEVRALALLLDQKNSEVRKHNKESEPGDKLPYMSWTDFLLDTIEADSINPEFKKIVVFLFDLSKKATQEPVEKIIDVLIGVEKIMDDENGYSDREDGDWIPDAEKDESKNQYLSPYKNQYFNKMVSFKDPETLRFLSNLRFLINKVRSLEDGSFIKLERVVEIIKNYQDSGDLKMIDKSPFISDLNAVNLMTVHKSKGLEFEHVFIIDCTQKSWKAGNSVKSFIPAFLHLEQIAEDVNDYIRLFYVAVTRAKKHVYFSYSQFGSDGNKALELGFLSDLEEVDFQLYGATGVDGNPTLDISSRELQLQALELELQSESKSVALEQAEKQNMLSLLEDYTLSVTHLNNFLDMERGGPKLFLEMNLLRFPQSKDCSSAYGTAVHAALCEAYQSYKKTKIKISTQELLYKFQLSLQNQKLFKADYLKMLQRGEDNLTKYWSMKVIEPNFEVERSFKGVKVGDAILGGNIDKILYDGDYLKVVDYKTGKPETELEVVKGSNKSGLQIGDFKEYKSHKHQNQLLFYKLLIEYDGSFRGKQVRQGSLEFPNVNDKGVVFNYIPELTIDLGQLELQKLTKVINAVWNRIQNLDFSLPKDYPATYKGTLEWIEDLIKEA